MDMRPSRIFPLSGQKGFTLLNRRMKTDMPLRKIFSASAQKGFTRPGIRMRDALPLRRILSLSGQAGFTLLETMIGLAILSGVIVTVLASLNYNLGVSSYDMDLVSATILGKELAEKSSLDASVPDGRGQFAGPFSRFSWSLDKEQTMLPGLDRLTIKVLWDEDRDVTFFSFKRK